MQNEQHRATGGRRSGQQTRPRNILSKYISVVYGVILKNCETRKEAVELCSVFFEELSVALERIGMPEDTDGYIRDQLKKYLEAVGLNLSAQLEDDPDLRRLLDYLSSDRSIDQVISSDYFLSLSKPEKQCFISFFRDKNSFETISAREGYLAASVRRYLMSALVIINKNYRRS